MNLEFLLKIVTHGIYPILLVVFFFGVTIFAHEWGHFLMARRRGMKVERFSIGFGPPIWKWERNGVEYRISWIPFGGYVALPQMGPMEVIEGKTEQTAAELPPVTPFTKILVAFAGPVMNVVFAFGLACILWVFGVPSHSTIVGWVEPNSAEEQAGIRPGDRVTQINDRTVKSWAELMEAVAFSRQPTVHVTVQRGGETVSFTVEAKVHEQLKIKTLAIYPRERPFARAVLPNTPAARAGLLAEDRFVALEGIPLYSRDQLIHLVGMRADQATALKVLRGGEMVELTVTPEYNEQFKAGRIGVELGEDLEIVRPGPAPLAQFQDVLNSMGRTVKALVHHRETGVGVSSMAGPVGISYMWWYAIVSGGLLMGIKIGLLLNLNLAILNLLPIPVLDGGHILFSTVEAALRKPLNAKFVQVAQTTFAALLIAFMLYITIFADLRRLWPSGKSRPAPAGEVMPVQATP